MIQPPTANLSDSEKKALVMSMSLQSFPTSSRFADREKIVEIRFSDGRDFYTHEDAIGELIESPGNFIFVDGSFHSSIPKIHVIRMLVNREQIVHIRKLWGTWAVAE